MSRSLWLFSTVMLIAEGTSFSDARLKVSLFGLSRGIFFIRFLIETDLDSISTEIIISRNDLG